VAESSAELTADGSSRPRSGRRRLLSGWFRAGREDAKQAKQLKTDIYWRRFDERRREKMSWYERVIIKNEITRTALAKEAGTSKDIVGEAILEIDRIIRCSQGMPWRRPKTVSADDFEMIRAGFYNRLARFF
jgi:hypothetical protein